MTTFESMARKCQSAGPWGLPSLETASRMRETLVGLTDAVPVTCTRATTTNRSSYWS